MKEVRIIGVPEHFNLPWHLAIEENAFANRGIDLQWTDIKEGTGRMCQMLRENQADIAIILTEGITADIYKGNPSSIVQEYIQTPLQWGIHVAAQSPFTKIQDIKNKKAAISRYGSGSHLMAHVHANAQGWDTEALDFEVINTLEGAVIALQEQKADYFMWEHFTTKPLVDNGTFRRITDFPTPWPCFVIAVNNTFLAQNSSVVAHILEVINTYTQEFKSIPSIDRTLANRYAQKLEDIQKWLSITKWSQKQLPKQTLDKVVTSLKKLDIIDEKSPDFAVLSK